MRRLLAASFGDAAVAFWVAKPLGIRELTFSGLTSHGPHLRLPTHRRRGYPLRRKAGYRPAGLALIGRVSHPLDDFSEFRDFLLSDQPFLVAPANCRTPSRVRRTSQVTFDERPRARLRRVEGHEPAAPAAQQE
jgi:hypothetical protein